jgi:hypothetical protein
MQNRCWRGTAVVRPDARVEVVETRELWAGVANRMTPQLPVHVMLHNMDCRMRGHTVSHARPVVKCCLLWLHLLGTGSDRKRPGRLLGWRTSLMAGEAWARAAQSTTKQSTVRVIWKQESDAVTSVTECPSWNRQHRSPKRVCSSLCTMQDTWSPTAQWSGSGNCFSWMAAKVEVEFPSEC